MLFESFRKFREQTPLAPAFLIASGDRFVPKDAIVPVGAQGRIPDSSGVEANGKKVAPEELEEKILALPGKIRVGK